MSFNKKDNWCIINCLFYYHHMISADCLIANHIKAKNVSLKSNCIVDLLEYTNTLIMDKTCKVKNIRKIENGKEL